MRKLLLAGAVALGSMAMAATSMAADWTPPGPIKMLIAFKAGGGTDTQARLIAEELEKRHGWKIQPEQLTGKGGAVLAAAMKDMPNDGSVIGIFVTETLGYNMIAGKKQAYTQEDFTPITTTASFQMGLVSLTSKGWKTMDDVVAAAKGGETLRFGAMSPKLGDIAYLISKHYGFDWNIVSVKGGKGVMNGLNGGDLDIGFGAGVQSKAVKAGDMINIASAMTKRLSISPDAPTLEELGVNLNADGYFMFAAPAGLPDNARDTIANAIAEIVEDESTKAHEILTKGFGGVVVIKGDALDAVLAKDLEDSKALLKAANE
ncbi:MAG: tripartite tricarboxylate transporter substrate binding protein [Pseudomonadota bacterium]